MSATHPGARSHGKRPRVGMDRHVSPRIAYWTSAYAPGMEAISHQVALLRRHFAHSIAWGLNRQRTFQFSMGRGFILSPRLWPFFRGATSVLQRAFHINHIVGGLGDWFYLRAATRRPIVLTAAVRSMPCDRLLLRKVDQFIVEWTTDVDALLSLGISADRVCVVPPPADLKRFSMAGVPSNEFTVLFASSPETQEQFDDRGIDILLDAATLRPQYRFVLLWRPWGNGLAAVRRLANERGLTNVEIVSRRIPQIEDCYRAAHLTVAPFRNPGATKSIPNSLIESMACGRPVICTSAIGFSKDVEHAGAGICIEPVADLLASATDDICRRWREMSFQARHFAERYFCQEGFIEAHRAIYQRLL